jgi:hypothetical protein
LNVAAHMTSRKHPPEPHENRLWKAGYAWSSFQYVADVCDYILSEKIPLNARIYYPLVTAISVLYARPFKRSKGIGKLTEQFVPRKFLKLHKQLILVRDQTTAHVDARGPIYQGIAANSVRLFVRNSGRQVALGMNQVKFNAFAISQIRELAGALVERMLKYIQKVASEYPNDVPNDGEYLIDLKTGTFRRL